MLLVYFLATISILSCTRALEIELPTWFPIQSPLGLTATVFYDRESRFYEITIHQENQRAMEVLLVLPHVLLIGFDGSFHTGNRSQVLTHDNRAFIFRNCLIATHKAVSDFYQVDVSYYRRFHDEWLASAYAECRQFYENESMFIVEMFDEVRERLPGFEDHCRGNIRSSHLIKSIQAIVDRQLYFVAFGEHTLYVGLLLGSSLKQEGLIGHFH